MSKVSPLHNEVHKNIKINVSTDFSRFKAQHLIPVVVQEFSPLASEFPIVFVKNSESGQFTPVAMMGIEEHINLYCQSNNWTSPVVPLGFKNAPLSLAKRAGEADEATLCIDEENPQVSTTAGEALFTKNGEQTAYLKERSQALINMVEYTQQTAAITRLFVDKGLLVSKQLTLNILEKPATINGLYIIDEEKLTTMASDEFEQLKIKGLLPLIYAHLTSLHQLNRLAIKQVQFEKQR